MFAVKPATIYIICGKVCFAAENYQRVYIRKQFIMLAGLQSQRDVIPIICI